MRPTISVLGEMDLISATKFGSYSSVLISVTLPVRKRSKMRPSFRLINRPNLLAGPGGKAVAVGVGVGAGVGVSVGSGVSVTVAVAVAVAAVVEVASGLSGSVAVASGVEPADGVPVGVPALGVRVGVGVGPGARAPQAAETDMAPTAASVRRNARRLSRGLLFVMRNFQLIPSPWSLGRMTMGTPLGFHFVNQPASSGVRRMQPLEAGYVPSASRSSYTFWPSTSL